MPRGWPPLTLRELEAILTALGLRYSHHEGGHAFWKGHHNGCKRKVTVAEHSAPFSEYLLKSMCGQAGSNRIEFYAATKTTARKIGVKPANNDDPATAASTIERHLPNREAAPHEKE